MTDTEILDRLDVEVMKWLERIRTHEFPIDVQFGPLALPIRPDKYHRDRISGRTMLIAAIQRLDGIMADEVTAKLTR